MTAKALERLVRGQLSTAIRRPGVSILRALTWCDPERVGLREVSQAMLPRRGLLRVGDRHEGGRMVARPQDVIEYILLHVASSAVDPAGPELAVLQLVFPAHAGTIRIGD